MPGPEGLGISSSPFSLGWPARRGRPVRPSLEAAHRETTARLWLARTSPTRGSNTWHLRWWGQREYLIMWRVRARSDSVWGRAGVRCRFHRLLLSITGCKSRSAVMSAWLYGWRVSQCVCRSVRSSLVLTGLPSVCPFCLMWFVWFVWFVCLVRLHFFLRYVSYVFHVVCFN